MDAHLFLNKIEQRALDEFRDQLTTFLGTNLLRLALFGSKTTKADTPESDIDVFVLVSDVAFALKDQVLDIAFEVNLKYGVYISPRVIAMSTFRDPVWSQTPFLQGLRDNGIAL